MPILLFLFPFILSFKTYAQVDTITANFLTNVIQSKNDSIYYTNKVDRGMYSYSIRKELKSKNKDLGDQKKIIQLSVRETTYLNKELKRTIDFEWPENLFSNSKRVNLDSAIKFLEGNQN